MSRPTFNELRRMAEPCKCGNAKDVRSARCRGCARTGIAALARERGVTAGCVKTLDLDKFRKSSPEAQELLLSLMRKKRAA